MNSFQLSENDLKIQEKDKEKDKDKAQYVFDPFNATNKYITKQDVETILRRYGVFSPIRNLMLYQRAFIHSSYVRKPSAMNLQYNIVVAPQPPNCVRLFSKSNERLEFIGDGILEACIKIYMYRRFPKATEGFMTDKKIAIVKNEHLGKLAMEIGLNPWYIISQYAESRLVRTQLEKLGCLFEAFLGALYLDFAGHEESREEWRLSGKGFETAQIFIQNVLERHVDWVNLVSHDDNYKNILQVIIQKEFKVTPHYMELDKTNDGTFHMGVFLCLGQPIHEAAFQRSLPVSLFAGFHDIHNHMAEKGKIFVFLGEGKHSKKKKAEQIACEVSLGILYRFVMYAVVQRELGVVPLVVEKLPTVEIVVAMGSSSKPKYKLSQFVTFSQIRELPKPYVLVISEGSHNTQLEKAKEIAFENAFRALKAFDI
jgi:dsRNA-specific ribonuclease